jgi:hypothetical protein
VNYDEQVKEIYERIARWLDIYPRYINLIGRNSPEARNIWVVRKREG